jgi:hypothetical protein
MGNCGAGLASEYPDAREKGDTAQNLAAYPRGLEAPRRGSYFTEKRYTLVE